MILADIIKHRIQIRLRRLCPDRGAPVARHPAVIDKGPWALRKIGDRAGWRCWLQSVLPDLLRSTPYLAALAWSVGVVLCIVAVWP